MSGHNLSLLEITVRTPFLLLTPFYFHICTHHSRIPFWLCIYHLPHPCDSFTAIMLVFPDFIYYLPLTTHSQLLPLFPTENTLYLQHSYPTELVTLRLPQVSFHPSFPSLLFPDCIVFFPQIGWYISKMTAGWAFAALAWCCFTHFLRSFSKAWPLCITQGIFKTLNFQNIHTPVFLCPYQYFSYYLNVFYTTGDPSHCVPSINMNDIFQHSKIWETKARSQRRWQQPQVVTSI